MSGSYATTDGQSHDTADVWFVADKNVRPPANFHASVNGMVNAMAAFAEHKAGAGGNALPIDPPLAAPQVGQMVATMKLYDANGKLLAPSGQAAPDEDSLKLKALAASNSGFLVSPLK